MSHLFTKQVITIFTMSLYVVDKVQQNHKITNLNMKLTIETFILMRTFIEVYWKFPRNTSIVLGQTDHMYMILLYGISPRADDLYRTSTQLIYIIGFNQGWHGVWIHSGPGDSVKTKPTAKQNHENHRKLFKIQISPRLASKRRFSGLFPRGENTPNF